MPGQNPAERHIQTLDNMEAAVTVDQDLLGPEFWGLASLAVAKNTHNSAALDGKPDGKIK
jgi:hypothetical protein